MKAQEVVTELIKLLLESKEFSGYEQENEIRIQTKNADRKIAHSVQISDYSPEFDVTLLTRIFIPDFVEEILKVVNQGAKHPYIDLSFAINVHHYTFRDLQFSPYTIPTEVSIEQTVDNFSQLFQQKIRPFIEKVSNLSEYESVVNNPVENHPFYPSNLDSKAILGIYLRSKTAPSTLPQLIKAYREAIRTMSVNQKEAFEKMVNHLGH